MLLFSHHLEPDVLVQLITIHLVTQVGKVSQLHTQLHHNQQATGETAAVIRARLYQNGYFIHVCHRIICILYDNCCVTVKA